MAVPAAGNGRVPDTSAAVLAIRRITCQPRIRASQARPSARLGASPPRLALVVCDL
jgi:hypothetical protein